MLRPQFPSTAALLAFLAVLLACQGQAPSPSPTETMVRSTIAGTLPSPANSPEPPATDPASVPMSKPETPWTPAPTPTKSLTQGPAAARTPFMEPPQTPGPEAITPILVEFPKSVENEVPDSELACMAGTTDAERLSGILTAAEEPAPEEMTQIMDCLQDETLLRMFLGSFAQYADPGPLSPKTSGCIRTSFAGIDPRRVLLAMLEGNRQDGMVTSAIILTITCLNEQEWDAATRALELHTEVRETMLCILREMGGPEEMVAALPMGGQNSAVILAPALRKCRAEMEDGPAAPAPTPTP